MSNSSPTDDIVLFFIGTLRVKEDYTLTVEQMREISSETYISSRVKAIKELAEVARSHRLEEVINIGALHLNLISY